MEFLTEANYLPIIVSAILSMLLGFAWYSKKLFGDQWVVLQKFTAEQMTRKDGMTKQLIWAFVLELILIGAFDWTLTATGMNPYCIGGLFAIGIMLPVVGGAVLWQKKSCKLFVIDFFYRLVQFLIIAIVFDALI